MQDRTLVLKLTGGMWFAVGILGLVWAVLGLLGLPLADMLSLDLGPLIEGRPEGLFGRPWAQIALIVCASWFLVVGWGLFRRHSWIQTLVVPAHFLFVVYVAVAWIAAYVVLGNSQAWRLGGSVPFVALILANIGLAIFMSSVGAKEALSWLPLQTSPAIPLTCEFCGTPLDPQTERCPQCEAVPEIVHERAITAPPHAKLISLTDETEFWIEPSKQALIGRGLAANDINLNNPTVSRRHAQIEYEDGHYVLTALRDSNGTFINNTLVRQRTLRDGDEVRFGRVRFQFTILPLERSDL